MSYQITENNWKEEVPIQEKITLLLKHDSKCAVEATGVCNCDFFNIANNLTKLFRSLTTSVKEETAFGLINKILGSGQTVWKKHEGYEGVYARFTDINNICTKYYQSLTEEDVTNSK